MRFVLAFSSQCFKRFADLHCQFSKTLFLKRLFATRPVKFNMLILISTLKYKVPWLKRMIILKLTTCTNIYSIGYWWVQLGKSGFKYRQAALVKTSLISVLLSFPVIAINLVITNALKCWRVFTSEALMVGS